MSNLFFIRNPFCIILAQQIIIQYGLENNIALIHSIKGNDDYSKNMIDNLNADIWNKILEEKLYDEFIESPSQFNAFNK